MRTCLLAAALAATVFAQSPFGAPVGRYHFVRLLAADAAASVASMGGSLEFDGKGGVRIVARRGEGSGAAVELTGEGSCRAGTGTLRIEAAALGGAIELLMSADGNAMTGPLGPEGYDFFAAVKAPEAAAAPALLEGDYGGGYLGLRNGERRQLASAFLELTSDGRGGVPAYAMTGHAARVDDVNRKESGKGLEFTLSANGTGRLRFAAKSDFVAGEREILAGAGGAVILGFGAGAGERDVFVLVRKARESSVFSLTGAFWLAELAAANGWAYKPDAARWNSGAGLARMDGAGTALLAQQVRHAGRPMRLVTSAPYRVGVQGTGSLGLEPVPDGNLALGGGNPPVAALVAGSRIGPEGKLTLEHGIFFGVRAAATANLAAVFATAPRPDAAKGPDVPEAVAARFQAGAAAVATREDFSFVDSSKPVRAGEKLFLFAAGFSGAPARVRFEGVAAEVSGASPVGNLPGVYRFAVTVPVAIPGTADAVVVIAAEDAFSDVLEVPVAR